MNNQKTSSLWINSTRTRYFLIPENQDIATGDLILFNLTGKKKAVSSTALTSFEVTEVEAMNFLEAELNQLMEQIEISEEIKNELPNLLEESLSLLDTDNYTKKVVNEVLNLAEIIDQSPDSLEEKIHEIITSLVRELFAEQEKKLEEKRKQDYKKSAQEAVTQSLSSFVLPSFADMDLFSEISLFPKNEQK